MALMERLDYQITINGIEERASADKALTILNVLYPATWEEIDMKMRWNGIPFRDVRNGRELIIEYKGPSPREALHEKSAI